MFCLVCPKCGVKIARFDLAPNCKKCGVHIMYYTQEEDLARDAKKCELEFARMHVLLEKIKLAFVKDKLALARMLIILVGAGCLFIPFAGAGVQLPFWSKSITISAWGAYSMFSDGILPQLLNIIKADIAPTAVAHLLASVGIFLVEFLTLLGVFGTMLLGFLNLKKSCRVMNGFSVAAAVLCVAGIVNALLFKNAVADSTMLSASLSAGYFVMLALLIALIAVNVVLAKKDPQPNIKAIDLERIEILKKVKSGEVKLDALPLPVCYSEEEERARTQFLGESNKEKKEQKGGADNG